MADNAPVMIWVTDPNKRFSFFNHTWLEYTGHELSEETSGGWMGNIHKDDVVGFQKMFDQCFDARKPFSTTFRLMRSDDKYCKLLCKAKPAYFKGGQFTGYIGSCIELPDDAQ